MHITLVKKILTNGEPCKKCLDVEERLHRSGYWQRIDDVVIADERDLDSPGMRLAQDLGVDRAPFFIVSEAGEQRIFTVYFKFVKEVLNAEVSSTEVASEILADNPDLDFL